MRKIIRLKLILIYRESGTEKMSVVK